LNFNFREMLSQTLGKSFGGKRDIYEAAGFIKNPTFDNYYQKYKRGLGGTIIDIMPKLCFSKFPEIYVNDTLNETVDNIFKNKLNFNLLKADKLSGINNFACIFLGFNDGNNIDTEVINASELIYTSTYMESQIQIKTYETNTSSLRFGQPLIYSLISDNRTFDVHYTRILHVAENPTLTSFLGTPRLERVLNNLDNIDKIIGAAGESYFKNFSSGMSFNMDPEAEITDTMMEKMTEEIDSFENGLSRFLKLRGVEPKKLDSDSVAPTEYINTEIKLISGILEIPTRLLIGSENNKVSSITDDKNMENKVQNRRDQYLTPFLYKPMLQRLIDVNIIEDKEYEINWKQTNNLSESETVKNNLIKATILEKLSRIDNKILTDDELKSLII